eukprot:UN09399
MLKVQNNNNNSNNKNNIKNNINTINYLNIINIDDNISSNTTNNNSLLLNIYTLLKDIEYNQFQLEIISNNKE